MTDKPSAVVADAQYWNEQHIDALIASHGLPVLIPPDGGKREGERPGWTGGRFSFTRRALTTELGKELYGKRQESIEPVFGHTNTTGSSTGSTTAEDTQSAPSGDSS